MRYYWGFFIAYASPDSVVAEELYEILSSHGVRVFLDTKCLDLGDDWPPKLAFAKREPQITVVLVSSKTKEAYYEQEEVASAIALARGRTGQHRIVPLYVDDQAKDVATVPYGLRIKHGLVKSENCNLNIISKRQLSLIEKQQKDERKI